MPQQIVTLGKRTLVLQTGEIARQASGSVLLREGETVLLATVVAAPQPSPAAEFLPLTVDVLERYAATGRIPGGYGRREGRPGEAQIVTARLIDRAIRPLFAPGFRCETQVQVTLLGLAEDADLEGLALIAAAAALHLSDLPWSGPLAGVRVSRTAGQWELLAGRAPVAGGSRGSDGASGEEPVVKPAPELELIVALTREGVVMLEGWAAQVPEADVLAAVALAQEQTAPLLAALDQLRAEAGRDKRSVAAGPSVPATLRLAVQELVAPDVERALDCARKETRERLLAQVEEELLLTLHPGEYSPALIHQAYRELVRETLRARTLAGRRAGGRGLTDCRPVACLTGLVPTNHGSALFTRGDTQVVVSATLAAESEALPVDGLYGRELHPFWLHYNFPGFATGEARSARVPGRREIGHGVLARRALQAVIPAVADFPYSIRVVADVTESDGSSSMATVCGASLALLAAGVPLRGAVAGVAMGLVRGEDGQQAILTDSTGLEDRAGDLDLKVAGTAVGITALQMDIKLRHLPAGVLAEALQQARSARAYLLEQLAAALPDPPGGVSPRAPQVVRFAMNPAKVGAAIGPGGKRIRELQARTRTTIRIDREGRVTIHGKQPADLELARRQLLESVEDLRSGGLYLAQIRRVEEYGVFVQIGDHSGLVHHTEFPDADRPARPGDPGLAEGDEVLVRLLGADDLGRLQISMRAAAGADPGEALNRLPGVLEEGVGEEDGRAQGDGPGDGPEDGPGT
ncbi:MAG: polyribonucleotide nucleotidyltransferase [Myxococcota bacterium]|jgi:polyribonucleotide nucleotidyltransferase|nr:polyribonucleotide nucleotidyltransferase [Myxococcota bacterium]